MLLFIHFLQVAITTPEGGSWGFPILRSLLTGNPHSSGKIGHTNGPTTLFDKSGVGLFLLRTRVKVLWDWTYGFSSLSEKTRKSNRLQMSLQRQHFLLSYLKTLTFGLRRFKPATSRSADGRSPNWANQVAVSAFYWHPFQNKLLRLRR